MSVNPTSRGDQEEDQLTHLTLWQQRRRRRRAASDRLMGLLFGLLAAAFVVYIIALADLVAPAFVAR